MQLKAWAIIALSVLLTACGGGQVRTVPPPRPPVRNPPPTQPAAPVTTLPRDAVMMELPGADGVIGAGANALVRQFGEPRLDVREGDVRKLQFAGEACVLDIFLYPVSASPEPLATFVDARRASDGLDVDRAACVRALRGY